MAATRPRVREEITVCGIDGEAVVYDPDGSKLHYLNHSAALVLDIATFFATFPLHDSPLPKKDKETGSEGSRQ